jgi:hypothetical protein
MLVVSCSSLLCPNSDTRPRAHSCLKPRVLGCFTGLLIRLGGLSAGRPLGGSPPALALTCHGIVSMTRVVKRYSVPRQVVAYHSANSVRACWLRTSRLWWSALDSCSSHRVGSVLTKDLVDNHIVLYKRHSSGVQLAEVPGQEHITVDCVSAGMRVKIVTACGKLIMT